MHAQQVTASVTTHGEGPVWSPAWGGLSFVDMLAGDVLRLDGGSGTVSRWSVSTVVAALRPRANGGVVAATESDFVLFDRWGGEATRAIRGFDQPGVRFNEGGCDPAGTFLCGSMAYDSRPHAAVLYALAPDLSVSVAISGVTVSNGLGFTAAGERAFYVDSATHRVDVLDWTADASLQRRAPFVTIDPSVGTPDGLCVDAEDGVWVALWGGGVVHRYDTLGRLDAVVDVGVPHVTACTFGGEDLRDLYITTSRLPEGSPPDAGALFRVSPGVRGLPTRPFSG